jgi:hypothetical protein
VWCDLYTRPNPKSSSKDNSSKDELHERACGVYRTLGRSLDHKTDEAVETLYNNLGKKRSAECVPLSEVVYTLVLPKYHLREYIRSSCIGWSASFSIRPSITP